MEKILMLDNYDSFTYNLVHYIEAILDTDITVARNDEITLDEVAAFDSIVLSPGPGLPKDAGIMPQLIKRFAGQKKLLGVCLGHQAIAEAFGGQLEHIGQVLHGIATPCLRTGEQDPVLRNIPDIFDAARYHSWQVSYNQFPDLLRVTAIDEQKRILALQHKHLKIYGVQFHPESVLTPQGYRIMENWLSW